MSDLQNLLTQYRNASATEREKGTYFEELIKTYFRYEATYAGLCSDVWLYADWARRTRHRHRPRCQDKCQQLIVSNYRLHSHRHSTI